MDGTRVACAARADAALPLPGTNASQGTLEYWLARYSPDQLDAPLLSHADILAYDERTGRRPDQSAVSQRDLRAPIDALALAAELQERVGQMRQEIERGVLVDANGHALDAKQRAAFAAAVPALAPRLRVMLVAAPLRCGPFPGALYKMPIVPSYDKNACGTLRAQEAVQVLATTPEGMLLARSRYSLGWLDASAQLSEPLSDAHAELWVHGARVSLNEDTTLSEASAKKQKGASLPLRKHTLLPVDTSGALVATDHGIRTVAIPSAATNVTRDLTRRALLTTAFRFVDSPYGLGDANGGRDCSGLVLDVFDTFDLALPRYSGWQADAGSYAIDLRGASESEKLRRLDVAAKNGVVLLYFPGHIMLYLGKTEAGVPLALHALGEYARPCAGGGETIVDVQHTVVSTLELGRGSSRSSFLERMTRLVVFGREPPPELLTALLPRQAEPPHAPASDATCSDTTDARIFVSPAVPLAGVTLRAIATSTRELGDAQLRLFDDRGSLASFDVLKLGGPPYSMVARSDHPHAGRYTVVLGSGSHVLACRRIRVHDAPLAAAPIPADAPIWEPRWRWERDTENLWSAFVERLFDGPPDDDQTWTSLHALLRDRNRNLLYDHLGLGEEDKLEIVPDCADLPYSLRAYFAWKLRLPYGFRLCSRGRRNQPPTCGELQTTLGSRATPNEVQAFSQFVNRAVRPGVHSATGRTHPADSETDLYPVALERTSLPPGTVYADPYGHVMMISKWFPEHSVKGGDYGVLMAAEAQPDGTVGRRRFWEGSFLFDPNTDSVGAGWKQFRPLVYDAKTHTVTTQDNAALEHSVDHARFSMQQYQGSREDFYDRMDTLINPEPLDPHARMKSLVDALAEAAERRVLAVDNGEHYLREHPSAVIDMPNGSAIFETEGAWEDYATPSRDMRILVALDTVHALPDRLRKRPERFALPPHSDAEKVAQQLEAELAAELRARFFTYTRSDGSPRTLTLADLAQRAAALEVAYDPNTCVETRWGAAPGSAEASTCRRSAPAAQVAALERFRTWFHTRTRPPRAP